MVGIILGICILAIFAWRKWHEQADEGPEMSGDLPAYLAAHLNLDRLGNTLPVAAAYPGYNGHELAAERQFSELPGIEVLGGMRWMRSELKLRSK
jgi:hypothetical protein